MQTHTFSDGSLKVNDKGVQGFAEGDDIIMFTPTEEGKATLTRSADGKANTFNMKVQNSGVLTIKLLKTSSSNALLFQLHKDKSSFPLEFVSGGEAVVVADGTAGSSPNGGAIIEGRPVESFGENVATLEWTFLIGEIKEA